MQISNDDLARILGRMEAKLDAQAQSSQRQEIALASLDTKLTQRLDGHESRLRVIEVANPAKIAESVKDHEQRIRALETSSNRAGVIAGIGSSVGVAVIVEIIKRKLGH
ncbi:hypothetical protein ACO0LD_03190 [Undibacterium sp. Ji83W]|uniref:hypothetical protein n=1 Tax=Undibacterium TaxID=401469 RepID=UPI003BF2900C